jgi:Fur family ferric uptake transcriptional regulator
MRKGTSKNNQKDPLRELLHKRGYKATPPRLAILALFKKHKDPMSAQRVIGLLPRNAGIDQATIYRTFKSLRASGIIRQVDLRHNHAHYEIADAHDHHHLVCLQCGRIEDVEHHEVDALEASILRNAKHFSEIREHALEFYGICKTCAKRKSL